MSDWYLTLLPKFSAFCADIDSIQNPIQEKRKFVAYVIWNKANQRFYVGQSNNYKRRFVHHKSSLRGNRHCNVPLQAEWNAQPESDFVFAVFAVGSSPYVCHVERLLVAHFGGRCYNMPKHTKETWRAKFPVGFGRGRPDLPRRIKPSQAECATP